MGIRWLEKVGLVLARTSTQDEATSRIPVYLGRLTQADDDPIRAIREIPEDRRSPISTELLP